MKLFKFIFCSAAVLCTQLDYAQDGQTSSTEPLVPESVSQVQEEDPSRQAPTAAAVSNRRIEQIDVIGERSYFTMRNQIITAEDSVYDKFNELNSSDEMDIVCDRVAPTMSHIKRRVCEPAFLTRLRAENAGDSIMGTDDLLTPRALLMKATAQMRQIEAEYDRLARAYPDFAAALYRFGILQAELEARKKAQWPWLFGDE